MNLFKSSRCMIAQDLIGQCGHFRLSASVVSILFFSPRYVLSSRHANISHTFPSSVHPSPVPTLKAPVSPLQPSILIVSTLLFPTPMIFKTSRSVVIRKQQNHLSTCTLCYRFSFLSFLFVVMHASADFGFFLVLLKGSLLCWRFFPFFSLFSTFFLSSFVIST